MARPCLLLKEDPACASLVMLAYLHKSSGSPEGEDDFLILHSEMMKYIDLACSEASFNVQLHDRWPSELVDDVP